MSLQGPAPRLLNSLQQTAVRRYSDTQSPNWPRQVPVGLEELAQGARGIMKWIKVGQKAKRGGLVAIISAVGSTASQLIIQLPAPI